MYLCKVQISVQKSLQRQACYPVGSDTTISKLGPKNLKGVTLGSKPYPITKPLGFVSNQLCTFIRLYICGSGWSSSISMISGTYLELCSSLTFIPRNHPPISGQDTEQVQLSRICSQAYVEVGQNIKLQVHFNFGVLIQ